MRCDCVCEKESAWMLTEILKYKLGQKHMQNNAVD